ncbi:DUF11 domain-containing protein [Patescibacteria group bacterium]|nr:DUF11 domain-containing protein [Patescibacteria group bacterium]MBU1473167.1 DUF11 domain-containing protein [Patescibacteria group bacterium]MBU2459773.1 DUF11 domain-containing protein [Patescibacteria group bacterium]
MPDPALHVDGPAESQSTQNHKLQKKTAILKWLAKLKQPKVFVPLSIFLIIYIALNVWVFSYGTKTWGGWFDKAPPAPAAPPTPTPTPSPIKDIPGGKQVYNVSNGDKVVGPKISQITLDPQTPTPDETQTVTIKVKNDSPVTETSVYIQTDNNELKHVLKLIEGTATDGTWQGSWKITDTYNYNYYFRFNLISATGEYNDGPRLR